MANINENVCGQRECPIGCTNCEKCIAKEILGERLDRIVYEEKDCDTSNGYIFEALVDGRKTALCIQIATAIKVHSPEFDANKDWWKKNREIHLHDVVDPEEIPGNPIFTEGDSKWIITAENPRRTVLFETPHFLVAVTYDVGYMTHDLHIYILKTK